MAKTVTKRKRGFFGWLFLIVFLGWNILMISWLVGYGGHIGNELATTTDAAASAGMVVGGTLGMGMILTVWLIGSVITGILALLTKSGKSVTYTTA